MPIILGIILVAALLVGAQQATNFIPTPAPSNNTSVVATITPVPTTNTPKSLSLGSFPLQSSDGPTLTSFVDCDLGKVSLKWNGVAGSSEYVIFRDDEELGRSTTTTFDDVDIVPRTKYCYVVRGKVASSNVIGSVLSDASNNQCVSTLKCDDGANVLHVGGPIDTPVPEAPTETPAPLGTFPTSSAQTPTPSVKPTKTPTPTPAVTAECQSTTLFNGKRVLNSKKFGTDAAAIQKALDCFKDPAYGGGAVYVPAGTYTVLSKIKVYSNVVLFGDGIDQTILQLDNSLLTSADGLLANDTNNGHENVTVRDMTLKGLGKESGVANCCQGIKLQQLEGGLLYKIKVEGFSFHGIWLKYKQQIASSGSKIDYVEHVRISNCQSINNKGSGVMIDAPQSNNVVDNCTISGNNVGSGGEKNGGAGITLFMDEDGLVTKNKILGNTVSGNKNKGIIIVAKNNITAIPTHFITNNAICNNTVENNVAEGIADGNSQESKYYANRINNNGDAKNGKITSGPARYWNYADLLFFTTPTGSNLRLEEDESPTATSPDCQMPEALATIPAAPPKAGVLGVRTQNTSPNAFQMIREIIQNISSLF